MQIRTFNGAQSIDIIVQKKFKYPTLSDKSALNIAKKLKEIEEREEKKKELIEQCAFDTWIEEKYMNIVY